MFSLCPAARSVRAFAAALTAACCIVSFGCDNAARPLAPPEPRFDAAPNSAPKLWETNAAVYWNGVARNLVVKNGWNGFQSIRGFAIVSVAQYNAAVAAEDEKDHGEHASVRAAVAGASVTALSYLHPGDATALEALLTQFLAADSWPGDDHTDPVAGEAVGRTIGQQVVDRAKTDRFFAPWTGVVPVGPGLWFSTASPPAPPAGALFGQAKTYFLETGSQFRPAPPPAFGSPAFLADLQEVRQISDTRTAEQDAIAKFWALPVGTISPSGYWNDQAAQLATRHRLNERDAAHLFALMNMAGFDGIVASHDAKFTYWVIRPTQADPAITLAIGLPNFPSYPSNHATVSSAMATIIGTVFPEDRERLNALAQEAAISRIYGGIHYRFDCDVGLALGRQVANYALSLDVNGHEPFVLK